MLQAGANVNYCGDSEYDESVNFIGLAIRIHRVDIVESLVRAGAKINPTDKALSDSALDIAASEGCQESFDFLAPLTKPSIVRRLSTASLPHGIKFRAYDEKWSYDFKSASANAHLQLVRSHIEQGLDIDIVGSNGATLLWTAAHNGHLLSIQITIK